MPAPKRSVQLVAAGVGIALAATTAGFLAGRAGASSAQPATPVTTAIAATPANSHQHGIAQTASAAEAGGPATGVKARRTWTDSRGNRFTVFIAFGPPVGGGTMCAVGGPAGYARGMVVMIQADPGNKQTAPGPRIGANGNDIAFSHGEYACSWDYANSAELRFAPGQARSFVGLVRKVKDPDKVVLDLTIGEPRKPKEQLARIPYRSIFS